jgi:hypothetical protein
MKFGQIVKITVVLALGTIVSADVRAQIPTLKGHTIGETIQQFLLVSDDLSARLALCRNLKDEKSARRQDVDWNACQQLIGAVDNKSSVIVASDCAGINTKTFASLPACLEFSGQVNFEDGKLAMMVVTLVDPWDNVYQDLVAKFGVPAGTGQETFKNAYGAEFHGSNAVWKAQDFAMTAREVVTNNQYMSDGRLRVVTIVLASSEAITRAAALAAQRKSTID